MHICMYICTYKTLKQYFMDLYAYCSLLYKPKKGNNSQYFPS